MTVAKLRKLANAAGYEIKRGFVHSEEGSRKAGQSGYELINMETGEAVTHSACGETWHFAYTLEEIEDFLRSVYEQAGMNWEPETGATPEDVAKAAEEEYISTEAHSILDKYVPMDADVKLEDCLEMLNRVNEGLKAEWDNVIGDTYELRLKLFLILQILSTSNMNADADGVEVDYTDSLNELAFQIVKCKIRWGKLDQEAEYASAE